MTARNELQALLEQAAQVNRTTSDVARDATAQVHRALNVLQGRKGGEEHRLRLRVAVWSCLIATRMLEQSANEIAQVVGNMISEDEPTDPCMASA